MPGYGHPNIIRDYYPTTILNPFQDSFGHSNGIGALTLGNGKGNRRANPPVFRPINPLLPRSRSLS